MKLGKILCIGIVSIFVHSCKTEVSEEDQNNYLSVITGNLPDVLAKGHADLIGNKLRHEALIKFSLHQLPDNLEEWASYSKQLRKKIIEKAGVIIDNSLPVNLKVTGTIQMKGYEVRNITFQTRPDVYTTSTLFVPEGKGPFPAVIVMCGHSANGRLSANYQSVGHTLALNGYVALIIDPWGAGERTTIHGIFEYHGWNLGASLMNIGESLMGMQITDNIRGVDLLCSLSYVDPQNIGATGSSGGGNQTMWLAALDERIKAAVPVVSVGTFESYVMRSNCICETLTDGLTFTEEAGILALARAIMPCNHKKDTNPAFLTSEFLRSYNNAIRVFKLLGKENNISYKIFDIPHGYYPQDREAMLGWFDFHLKGIGTGAPKKEIPFILIPEEKLMAFPSGNRDAEVLGTDEYCRQKGNELRELLLNTGSFNKDQKIAELKNILGLDEKSSLRRISQYNTIGGWERFALETTDDKLIPVLHLAPITKSQDYIIFCNSGGKDSIPSILIDESKQMGLGIVIVELTGTGEHSNDKRVITSQSRSDALTTLARAELWLGKTLIGEWVKDLRVVCQFLDESCKHGKLTIDGSKEAGVAALFYCLLERNTDNIILRDSPISYLFDSREYVNFFTTAIHLPGILIWGDISLAAALSGVNTTFIDPVTMSGQKVDGDKLNNYKKEFEKLRNICRQSGKTFFY